MTTRLNADAGITAMRLAVFREVVRRRGFGKAAEARFLTPPSVTAHVQALERAWGVVLFDRAQHGAVLTEAGQVAYESVDRILNELNALQGRLDQVTGRAQQKLLATAFPAGFLVPDAVARLAQHDPELRVVVDVASSDTVGERVRRGDAQAGLMSTAGDHHGLESDVVWREPIVLIVPPGHELAGRSEVAMVDLAQFAFVVGPTRGAADIELDATLQRATGRSRRVALEAGPGNHFGVKEAIAAGAGIGLIYRTIVDRDLAEGRVVEVGVDDLPSHETFLIVHRGGADAPFASALARAVRGAAPAGRS